MDRLDVIETAIRNAFEKGDSSDRAFRERVYRSAFAALERALKANPNVTVEMAIARRKRMQSKIAEIESEFIPAAPPVEAGAEESAGVTQAEEALSRVSIEPKTPPAEAKPEAAPQAPAEPPPAPASPDSKPRPQPEVEPAAMREPARPVESASAPEVSGETLEDSGREPAAAPEVVPDTGPAGRTAADRAPAAPAVEARPAEPVLLAGDPRVEPRIEEPAPAASAASSEGEIPPQRERVVDGERRRPWAATVLVVALLAAVGVGGWWSLKTGLIKLPGQAADDLKGVEQVIEQDQDEPGAEPAGAPSRPGEADARRDWIIVFAPDDPTSVSAPAGAKADAMNEEGESFLRIRSGASGSAIVFDVGQGVLEQLAGKRAVFDIVARAEEGKETQISVNCSFGELGGCGRKRYEVGYEKGEFLFEVDLPDKRPGSVGTIAINSDIANTGQAIDVFEIKASVAE